MSSKANHAAPAWLVSAVAAVCAFGLAAPVAHADSAVEEGAWTLAIASRSQLVRDASFDVFSGNDVLSGFDLSLMRRVWSELSVGVAWQAGGASEGFIFDQFNFDYRHQSAVVGVLYESTQLSRQLVGADWLRPTVRAEGGVVFGRASVTLQDVAGEVAAEQIQWKIAPRLHAGVGLRIVPFSNARVPTDKDREEGRTPGGYTFALDAEVGWSLLTRLKFDALEPDPDGEAEAGGGTSVSDDDPAVPRHPLELGELILEGAEIRLGVLMRF